MIKAQLSKFDLEERSEILSLLPSTYDGKDVIELGLGYGRFTGTIAKSGGQVVAVDHKGNIIEKVAGRSVRSSMWTWPMQRCSTRSSGGRFWTRMGASVGRRRRNSSRARDWSEMTLAKVTLAKIWQFDDHGRTGFLSRVEFYNALKLVRVAQTGREITPELVCGVDRFRCGTNPAPSHQQFRGAAWWSICGACGRVARSCSGARCRSSNRSARCGERAGRTGT